MAFYIGRFKGLEWKEFEAEVVTPLFLAGADPNKPELRAPSIKGALRFWWRALHPDLSLEQLRKQEAELFGDPGDKGGKSKVRIGISRHILYDGKSNKNPLPHKKKKFGFPCFNPGEIFALKIFGDQSVWDLFQLVSIVGGLGKRSRRGFGSFRITKIDGSDSGVVESSPENILALLNSLNDGFFKIKSEGIIRRDNPGAQYPYIKKIEIGKSVDKYQDLLAIIGRSSHDNNSDYTGYAGKKGRFSSPIYVSVIKSGSSRQYKPIITTLNTAFKSNGLNHGLDTSENFKRDILSGGTR